MQRHRSPIDHSAPYRALTPEAQSQARATYRDAASHPDALYCIDRDGDVRGRSLQRPRERQALNS